MLLLLLLLRLLLLELQAGLHQPLLLLVLVLVKLQARLRRPLLLLLVRLGWLLLLGQGLLLLLLGVLLVGCGSLSLPLWVAGLHSVNKRHAERAQNRTESTGGESQCIWAGR